MKIYHFIYKRGVRVRFRPPSHGVDYGTNRNVQYQLDGLGNRIFMTDSSPLSATESTRTALRYNGFNQLNTKEQCAAPFAVTNFAYDNNGNLLSETQALAEAFAKPCARKRQVCDWYVIFAEAFAGFALALYFGAWAAVVLDGNPAQPYVFAVAITVSFTLVDYLLLLDAKDHEALE